VRAGAGGNNADRVEFGSLDPKDAGGKPVKVEGEIKEDGGLKFVAFLMPGQNYLLFKAMRRDDGAVSPVSARPSPLSPRFARRGFQPFASSLRRTWVGGNFENRRG
jgi:hypothetical protein